MNNIEKAKEIANLCPKCDPTSCKINWCNRRYCFDGAKQMAKLKDKQFKTILQQEIKMCEDNAHYNSAEVLKRILNEFQTNIKIKSK